MNIKETEIIDCNCTQNDENAYKILMMDQIIECFVPVFGHEVERKKSQLNDNIEDISRLKDSILECKQKLKSWLLKIKLEKTRKIILAEIYQLHKKDLIYGKIKQQIKDILFSLDSKDMDELTQDFSLISKIKQNK